MGEIPRAEELVGAQFLDVFPVGAVGREGKGGIVGDDINGGGVFARREDELVGLEEFAGQIHGGGHHAGDGAEVELD